MVSTMLDGQALCQLVGFDVEAGFDMLIPFPRIRCSFAWCSKIARGPTEPFVVGKDPAPPALGCSSTCPSTDDRKDIIAQPQVRRQISFSHLLAQQYLQRAYYPYLTMGIAQYNNNYRQLHSLKVTATILTHLATQSTPAIPGRHNTKSTQLPGIRSLFTIDPTQAAAVLPPLQCAVGLINLGTPLTDEHQSPVASPTKPVVGSPTSPGMTPTSPLCHVGTNSPSLTISPKTRRPLSLHDLLSAAPAAPSIQRCKNIHHRRQCGITDCHKYALTGGFCIRHGGGKRCNFEGCQTVAQSGGRCKAHGGGSKCKVSGCGSVARRKGFCMTHGGRQQCKIDGCTKCAHGGGFCISHGGGKRCSSKSCNKSAQAGGFCYSHGGGKRCAAPECFQAARKGGLCIRHRKAAHNV